MTLILWLLCVLSLIGVWYSSDIHLFLTSETSLYRIESYSLVQVVFAVLAGILATKASDSSRELKKLLKISDIQKLLEKADQAASKSHEEKKRLKHLVNLVGYQVEQQFTREMLINHRRQLAYHWEQVLKLESVFEKEETSEEIDPKVKKIIQNYIIKTQFIEYMGRGFLRGMPFFGRLLDYLFGPLWSTYYLKNLPKLKKLIKKDASTP